MLLHSVQKEDVCRSPRRRWADIEELAPWNSNKAGGGGTALLTASKRAAQDHRVCQTSTLDVTIIKENLQASPPPSHLHRLATEHSTDQP